MKHASAETLQSLTHLLEALRRYPALTERKIGVFYQKAAAFVHFHEDPKGMFADLKTSAGWQRMPVNSKLESKKFIAAIQKVLGKNP